MDGCSRWCKTKTTHRVYRQLVNMEMRQYLKRGALLNVGSVTHCNCPSAGSRMPLGCCHLNNETHVKVLEMHMCTLQTDPSWWDQWAQRNWKTVKMSRSIQLCRHVFWWPVGEAWSWLPPLFKACGTEHDRDASSVFLIWFKIAAVEVQAGSQVLIQLMLSFTVRQVQPERALFSQQSIKERD